MNIKSKFPIISTSGLNLAVETVNIVDQEVRRVKWSNQQIDDNYGNRSPEQILKSKETGYMNPCLDLTLATGSILQYNGIPWHLIIEEHGPTKEFPLNRLHFAVDFKDSGKEYFINFFGNSIVQVGQGNYQPRKDLPFIKKLEIKGANLSYNLPIYKSLGFNSRESFLNKDFKNVNLEKLFERLKEDNTRQRYLAHKAQGNNFRIKIAAS